MHLDRTHERHRDGVADAALPRRRRAAAISGR